jgi:predicted acylesterase/phospholipase RssA/CRP-like cAMP-binding protein
VDEAIYAALAPRELRGGEWLFREGEPGDDLYFLVRGRLQAWAGAGADESPPRLLGEVLPGDSVGEAGLLTGAPRSAGVRAIRDSLLIRLARVDFEQLVQSHPRMVLKLASHVASLMQKNLAGAGDTQRGYRTIALMSLHDTPAVKSCVQRLTAAVCRRRETQVLSPRRLQEQGAPEGLTVDPRELPERTKQWLSDQEDEHELVLYHCGGADDAWTRFCVRQADLTVMIADAGESPGRTAAEDGLRASGVSPAGRLALLLLQPGGGEIRGTAAWLDERSVDFHLHLRDGEERDLERVARVLCGQAIGLVLGAGAVRGLAELGVYRALVEAGVPIDWVGGSSIGSIVGAAIAHDWSPRHAIDLAREAFVKGKPFSDYTLPVVSLIRGRRMVKLLKSLLDIDIEDLPIPYFCVSSLLDRGEVHVHDRGSLVAAVRASAALPGVLPPAVVNSELAVDGAVLNNLPVDLMQRRPVQRIVAVDVSFRDHRQVDYEETPAPWAILRGRWLPFARRYRVPGMATLILRSTEIGTLAQSRQRGDQADLLINPPVRQFGMTDVKAFDRIVEAGYEHGRERLAEWLAAPDGAAS